MESGSGTITGYRIEAMTDSDDPMEVSGNVVTQKWKRMGFAQGSIGVPISRLEHELPFLAMTGCYSYEAAQALRWWFHASAGFRGICIRSRLVKVAIKYSIDTERLSEHCEIHGDDRSNCMPDWGSKK